MHTLVFVETHLSNNPQHRTKTAGAQGQCVWGSLLGQASSRAVTAKHTTVIDLVGKRRPVGSPANLYGSGKPS